MAKNRSPSAAGRAGSTDAGAVRRQQKARRRRRPAKGAPASNQPAPAATSSGRGKAPLPEAAGAEMPPASAALAATPHVPAVPTGPVRVIEPSALGIRRYAGEMWRHRPAFIYFGRRYMRKRYGRTFFGYLWFFIPIILPLFIGTLVFGGILGVSVPGVPYFLYFCVALGTWLLFSQVAYFSTRSLEISRNDIRRLYVPRLIPLMSAMTLPTISFLIYIALGIGTVVFYVLTRGEFYLELRPATLLVPCALAMLVVFGWACGLWFSPLAPRARDVRRMAGYVLGIWYFLTPVMYPIEQIPSGYRFLASLNPITAPIELVKNGLLDVGDVTSLGLASYSVALVVASVGGLRLFLSKERRDVAFY